MPTQHLNPAWPPQRNPKFLQHFLHPLQKSRKPPPLTSYQSLTLISFLEQTTVKCPVFRGKGLALHSRPHSLGHLRKGGRREGARKGGRLVQKEQEGDSRRPGWTNFRSKDLESWRAVTAAAAHKCGPPAPYLCRFVSSSSTLLWISLMSVAT